MNAKRMAQIRLAMLTAAILTTGAMAQTTGAPQAFVNTLMPQPAQLTARSGLLPVAPGFAVSIDKFDDERLDGAVAWAMRRMTQQTGIQIQSAAKGAPGALVITVDAAGEAVQGVDEDESYSLEITPQSARLHAATDVGAMRGLETVLQLLQSDGQSWWLPDVSIQDSPRFRWRGLMIDCSRHFEPVGVIERTLDGMAAVKMNVFHWHLSDDQGFRIESKVFPKLTEDGSDGMYYTQDQAREVVAYARSLGIRVVPEFDMPGHTTSWMVGYPDLASAKGPFSIERHFGVFDPVMDPTRESTYVFLDKFIGEMAEIFPDAYMHIGGDENNGVEWKQNPEIQAFMHAHDLKDTAALQNYFNQKLLVILTKHHKKMIGWDEIFTPGLPKDVMVQSWRGFDSLAATAKQGYSGILSAGYYLDHMQSAATHYRVDPVPAKSDLTPEQAALILGGEACSWGEYVDPRTIDSRIWPRTAAIAERLWSPQSVNNIDDMYRRLWVESLRLEGLGLTQISQEDASLRALAGTEQIDALRPLAAVLEPVDFDERSNWSDAHGVTTLTPLDRLVDALPPDPPSRHGFAELVSTYLQDPTERMDQQMALLAMFRSWTAEQPEMVQLMSASPLLAEAQPRAQQLADLGAVGTEAVAYLSSGTAAPPGWKVQKLAILDQAETPVALTEFTVLKPLRDLVNEVK
ncbi:MAG TPA: family 20 glycosylhydrolase [Acidobacteriaceae bacterium]|nr:family 20 glycosylhydrolase [Acidobacteriaceae bacterium]